VQRAVAAHAQGAHLQIGGELQVGVAIANDRARLRVDLVLAQVRLHKVRTHQHRLEVDALGAEGLEDELLCRAAESVLVRDHDEAVTTARGFRERGEHPGHEAHPGEALERALGGLLDERAVPVDEQSRGAHRHASSNRSFCAAVPTVIRSDCGSPG